MRNRIKSSRAYSFYVVYLRKKELLVCVLVESPSPSLKTEKELITKRIFPFTKMLHFGPVIFLLSIVLTPSFSHLLDNFFRTKLAKIYSFNTNKNIVIFLSSDQAIECVSHDLLAASFIFFIKFFYCVEVEAILCKGGEIAGNEPSIAVVVVVAIQLAFSSKRCHQVHCKAALTLVRLTQ